jgi:diaminohydroxyphosphoribosylaminopyrimidine deaminase/5-amino-6-(5-phosphoribosylamino)uracil reductase
MVTELDAMRRALELALRGWGRVAPNPLTGAVLLRAGEVIGEGWHAEFGGPHAEAAALAGCSDARGATCVVNLEPCAHVGKTPACSEALMAAGVGRVVAAVRDPHPVAAGGLDRLREAGVDVALGLAAAEAAALNAPFLFSASGAERPFVALKLATSLDGFLADHRGRSQWISGPEAREYVHWLRAGFEAVGVGRRTAVTDDPLLTARGAVNPRVPPTRVVFTTTGELPERLRLWDTAQAPTAVVRSPPAALELRQALAHTQVTVIEGADLAASLVALRRHGIGSILVEGGGALSGALLEAGFVDRLYWIKAPIWLGQGIPAFGGSGERGEPGRGAIPLDQARAWTVTEHRALGADTLLVVDRELCLQES